MREASSRLVARLSVHHWHCSDCPIGRLSGFPSSRQSGEGVVAVVRFERLPSWAVTPCIGLHGPRRTAPANGNARLGVEDADSSLRADVTWYVYFTHVHTHTQPGES